MLLIPINVVYTRVFCSRFLFTSLPISLFQFLSPYRAHSCRGVCTQSHGDFACCRNKTICDIFCLLIHLYDALLLLHLFRRIYLFNHLMHVSFCIEFVTLHERIKTELLNAWMLSQRMNGFHSNILVSLLVLFHSFPVPWCQDFVCFLLMTGSP